MTVINQIEGNKSGGMNGTVIVPGDKSISHRAVLFGSIAEGKTEIDGFLNGADCRSTISCMRHLGINIEESEARVIVNGKGLFGLDKSETVLDTGNSGTTFRLISGILSGQEFESHLDGDSSIRKRPMGRIIKPLTMMGAKIKSENNNDLAPLSICPSSLHGIDYKTPVASAQVKSAILLAGLYADGETYVTEPVKSRDHTERMLGAFGANISINGNRVGISDHPSLKGMKITVPGDISSAAYFLAAGLIVPNSCITVLNVGINPTRSGIIDVIKEMGGNIVLENKRIESGEPVADITVRTSALHGIDISGDIIPALIDEIPVISVMASVADGTTNIRDASELRVKESDRVKTVTENLRAMGADIEPHKDGMTIIGGRPLHGAYIHTYKDHRLAMSMAVAGLIADGVTSFDDSSCVYVSYPGFFESLKKIRK